MIQIRYHRLVAAPLRWILLGCAVSLALLTRPAQAYTYETAVSSGCHERITGDALSIVRSTSTLSRAAWTAADPVVLRDLPFDARGFRDEPALALLIGARDNDLRGRAPADLGELAAVHGDPGAQREHCLRGNGQTGEAGARAAIVDCRAFILEQSALALGVSATAYERVRVFLAVRGGVDLELRALEYHAGRALHALQDSFTHTYRGSDGREVVSVLTWVGALREGYDEAVDGPPHSTRLDQCDRDEAVVKARVVQAEHASVDLLAALYSPGSPAARLVRVEQVLDVHLPFRGGCSLANDYCGAPERALRDSSGCRLAGEHVSAGSTIALVLLGISLTRRRARRSRALASAAKLATLGAALGLPSVAEAQEAAPPAASPGHLPAYYPGGAPFSVTITHGAALDRTALSHSVGIRYRLDDPWVIGLDLEHNPWVSLSPFRTRPGALNLYATLIRRYTVHSTRFALRTTAHLGTSTALFDLYGVPRGSTGPYFGLNLLGFEWRAASHLTVVVDPADVAIPVPQVRGVPFAYLQYRVSVGLQWDL